jgi:gliding motility-associated-like protein
MKFFSTFILYIIFANFVFAQITVTTGIPANTLVQDVLVGGGVTVNNIQYTGHASSIGRFQTGTTPTNLGLSSGILMSTGNINSPQVGSSASVFASSNLGQPGYQLLTNTIGATTYDAAVLDFYFVPISDTIKFRYVFASEEYHEFVNSNYNDVFGFFLTGPNPQGPYYNNRNIARIPGTQMPVAINTVNNGFSNSACASGPCNNCQHFVDNCYGTSIIYDGFTKVLTAWAVVVPCETYRIILAIADTYDPNYDSGVFLEANSFSSSGVMISTSSSNPAAGNDAIRNCNNIIINFCLSTPSSTDSVVTFTIGGSAINGVDYQTIPTSVTIPAGQLCTQLVIIPTATGSSPGSKTITLDINVISCGSQLLEITILDNTPLQVSTSGNASTCGGAAVQVSANASGGLSPYTYSWSNNLPPNQNHTVNPTSTTTYTVTASDICGQTATSSVTVSVTGNPTISISPNSPTICIGSSVQLQAQGGASYVWSNNAQGSSINVTPTQTTTYTVTGTDSYGCTGSASVIVSVVPQLAVTINATPSQICLGGSANLQGQGALNYAWSTNQQGATISVSPSQTTTYTVTGSDNSGCSGTASTVITVLPSINVTILPSNPNVCSGEPITLTASGASTYVWSNGQSNAGITVTPTQTTTYSVTATDNNNCTGSASITVVVHPNPTIIASTDYSEVCTGTPVQISAIGGQNYIWNNGNTSSSFSETLTETTTYSVTGTDMNGCTGTSNITVEVFESLSLTITPSNPNVCEGDSITITVNSNGVNPVFIWDNGSQTASITVQPSETTEYSVEASDAYGCTGSAVTSVVVNPIPSVDFVGNPLEGCRPLTVLFSSSTETQNTVLWDFGDGNTSSQNNPTHQYTNHGTYTVSLLVTSPNFCTNFLSYSNYVQVNPVPIAKYSIFEQDEYTFQFIDESMGATSWLWSFDSNNPSAISIEQNPTYTYIYTGKYTTSLIVWNDWNCLDSTSRNVNIVPISTFYIPNTFTPDGNGMNDFFFAVGENIDYDDFKMSIFNRWGELIFSADNYFDAKWNGTYRYGNKSATLVPQGTYIYSVEVYINNKKQLYQGHVNVIYNNKAE